MPLGQITHTSGLGVSPIVCESNFHLLSTGQHISLWGCKGNRAANGYDRVVTVVDADHFSLDGTVGSGDWLGYSAMESPQFTDRDVGIDNIQLMGGRLTPGGAALDDNVVLEMPGHGLQDGWVVEIAENVTEGLNGRYPVEVINDFAVVLVGCRPYLDCDSHGFWCVTSAITT